MHRPTADAQIQSGAITIKKEKSTIATAVKVSRHQVR